MNTLKSEEYIFDEIHLRDTEIKQILDETRDINDVMSSLHYIINEQTPLIARINENIDTTERNLEQGHVNLTVTLEKSKNYACCKFHFLLVVFVIFVVILILM
jgi:t-SNARE complex subunit (syntaxin)